MTAHGVRKRVHVHSQTVVVIDRAGPAAMIARTLFM